MPISPTRHTAQPCKTFYSGNRLLKKSIVAQQPNETITRVTSTKKRQDRPVPIDKVKLQIEQFIADKKLRSPVPLVEEEKLDDNEMIQPQARIVHTE